MTQWEKPAGFDAAAPDPALAAARQAAIDAGAARAAAAAAKAAAGVGGGIGPMAPPAGSALAKTMQKAEQLNSRSVAVSHPNFHNFVVR